MRSFAIGFDKDKIVVTYNMARLMCSSGMKNLTLHWEMMVLLPHGELFAEAGCQGLCAEGSVL